MISIWVKNIPLGTKGIRVLDGSFARETGIPVSRGSTEAKACYKVRIVLRFEYWHGKSYFILTAYPMV
ncbi:RNase A-like domain-containing protein [Pantoea ananatis]|uniref:RNase A-like domain-containing protein n=1 Tax=Pantoea ananas TaxID=553 RepID=UPI003CF44E3C